MRITVIILSALLVGAALGYYLGHYSADTIRWVDTLEEAGVNLDTKDEKEIPVNDDSSPMVKVDNPVYDFGILEKNEANEKGVHDFILENVGGSELTLTEGGKGCMCTNFSISKKTLKKGEKGIVKFSWDGSRGGGVFEQSVRVSTNDPKQKELYLTVRGLYTAPIVSNPNQIVFHSIQQGTTIVRDFKVFGFEKDKDGKPFPLEITEATISNTNNFDIEIKKGTLDSMSDEEKSNTLLSKATTVFHGKLTLKPGLPQGAFQEVIRLKTNDKNLPMLEIMVEGQITGSITMSGNRYDRFGNGYLGIGSISSSQTTTERIRLTVVDKYIVNDKTVRVDRIRPDWLKVNFKFPDEELQKKMPAKMIDVEVSIPKGSPLGTFMGPARDKLGEVVFKVGPEGAQQEIVLPVQFAVGP